MGRRKACFVVKARRRFPRGDAKGTNLAGLAVERSIKFQFAINLKSTKWIGYRIPPNVLLRANRVIR